MSYNEQSILFNNLSMKFSQLLYGRSTGDRIQLSKLLEEISNLDYRYPVVDTTTKAVLLIHQCCTIIPPDDTDLVLKCCKTIDNLISHQHVQIEGQTLTITIQWCLQAIKHVEVRRTVEILLVLNLLLRNNTNSASMFLGTIVCDNSPIPTLAREIEHPEIALCALQCIEACTIPEEASKTKTGHVQSKTYLDLCVPIFLRYLRSDVGYKYDCVWYCKLLISCLNGLRNIITQDAEFLKKDLGLHIGVSKSYMVYGIKGIDFMVPENVKPSMLRIAEPVAIPKEKKGGKIAKQRKHRVSQSNKKDDNRKLNEYISATGFELNVDNVISQQSSSRLKTSDSDFSDTEGGRAAKLQINEGRVRQAALSLLLQIVKLTDKPTIFCYWSSLIPDDSSTNSHNLVTCILKDPSPKGRMSALNVLLALLTSSKMYLFQAEFSEKCTAYTPFSILLGSMVKDLHKYLSLALNENSIPVLTHVLKCLGALVQATPYHKLQPGIIKKIMRNVKVYIRHRDATVQVAALIVLGCIISSEPTIPETKDALLKQIKSASNPPKNKIKSLPELENEIDYVDFSSDDEEASELTPQEVPWLLQQCLNNLGISTSDEKATEVPAPVKLESLQVISVMTRNYFDCLIIPYISLITRAIDNCLSNKYADLRLHAGRAVDFIGQAMNQHFNSAESDKVVIPEQGLFFWQTLLNNSLPSLLQSEEHSVLRAVGCDCFGSIGPHVFENIARDKQILIITLLFACTRDKDNNVRAAAVRALAICVLYPSLREDNGFVVDVAEAILRTLRDEILTVRIKASWSLGNLSDAVVLNKNDQSEEDIPESLLIKLLEICVELCNENDKIKANSVRALGNFLQLITKESLQNKHFKETTNNVIRFLVNILRLSTNMKVKWNACYAVGNVLKNAELYVNDEERRAVLFNSLVDLVVNFPNFKVRINAALALSTPCRRDLYGGCFVQIWKALLHALENTQNVEDFNEYNHRDHLVDQICLTIAHLTTLATLNDLESIEESTSFYIDLLKLQMHKVIERLVPEKSAILLFAHTHLHGLHQNNLQKEYQKVVTILLDVYKC